MVIGRGVSHDDHASLLLWVKPHNGPEPCATTEVFDIAGVGVAAPAEPAHPDLKLQTSCCHGSHCARRIGGEHAGVAEDSVVEVSFTNLDGKTSQSVAKFAKSRGQRT